MSMYSLWPRIKAAAGSNNVIRVDPGFGIMMSGDQLSISAMPAQIYFGGGYWRFDPLLLTCLPSTTPTPIPTLVKDSPNLLAGASDLASSMKFLTGNSDLVRAHRWSIFAGCRKAA